MGLDGGGGGTILGAGNAFTGPAQALELVNQFCYAYSGTVAVQTSETTLLEFTTGNYTAVVGVQASYPSNNDDDMKWSLYLNDGLVQRWMNTGSNQPNQPPNPMLAVIPPYTAVKVSCQASGSGRDQIVSITGRIYRG